MAEPPTLFFVDDDRAFLDSLCSLAMTLTGRDVMPV